MRTTLCVHHKTHTKTDKTVLIFLNIDTDMNAETNGMFTIWSHRRPHKSGICWHQTMYVCSGFSNSFIWRAYYSLCGFLERKWQREAMPVWVRLIGIALWWVPRSCVCVCVATCDQSVFAKRTIILYFYVYCLNWFITARRGNAAQRKRYGTASKLFILSCFFLFFSFSADPLLLARLEQSLVFCVGKNKTMVVEW